MLVVFLFAAVLAISLYMEMPSVAFEAKRAKEQLLIDRGHEYAHAVKLYYRKFRAYPPSIDALENTNRIRFLRHRFKDPMTGEDKWRLLHAGPGGQLIDSKVNPIGLAANGQTSTNATNGFGNNNTSASFSANNAGQGGGVNAAPGTTPTTDNGSGVIAGVPQRPPEMPINGGGAPGPGIAPGVAVDPTQSLMGAPPMPDASGQANEPVLQGQMPPQSQGPQSAAPVPGIPAAPAGVQGTPGQLLQPRVGGGSLATPMQGVQGLFANPNPQGVPENPATTTANPNFPTNATSGTPGVSNSGSSSTGTTQSSGMGVLQSGGIAGVASLAKGSTIKLVNDQNDYSLWEFYYDPTKDTSMVGQSGINPLAGVQQQQNALTPSAMTPTNANTNNSNTTTPGTTTPQNPAPAPPSQQQ